MLGAVENLNQAAPTALVGEVDTEPVDELVEFREFFGGSRRQSVFTHGLEFLGLCPRIRRPNGSGLFGRKSTTLLIFSQKQAEKSRLKEQQGAAGL